MGQYPDRFTEGLLELTRLMVDEETLDDTLDRIAGLACRTIEVCSHASITLSRPKGPVTAAATDDTALACDHAQYDADEGPCLQALRTSEVVHVTDTTTEVRFPAFTRRAVDAGIGASLSLPLVVRGDGTGALNLYAEAKDAYARGDEELGRLFAAQSAVAISNAEVYWKTYNLAQNLQVALETRDVIGQAKGVLMATQKISSDEAFDLLRRRSQHANQKLRDVADHVVLTGTLEPPS